MLAIILASVGSVAAATGFMLIGVSKSEFDENSLMTNVSWVLIVGGVIMAVLGGLWYRSNEALLAEERSRSESLTRG